jgi:nitronate monooxygenase
VKRAAFLNSLGINQPIIQAPMAGVQGGALAAAVANAGGLGSIPCAMLTADAIVKEIEIFKAATVNVGASLNLNFFCHQTPSPNEQEQQAWKRLLNPYYEEFGIDPDLIIQGAGRTPFNEAGLAIVQAFRPTVVSFHFGLPAPSLLQAVKATGALVLSSATTVKEALWLQAHGVDAVIAQGLEAGGHRGLFLTDELSTLEALDLTTQVSTFALLPQIVKALRLPVIATGGIADAVGVKAVLDLGASLAQVGTAYLLCKEATTSEVHRRALASREAQHTALTNLFTGRPARGIVNRAMRELGSINATSPRFPLATSAMAPLRTAAEKLGLGDFSPLWSGQNTSGCKAIGAQELTKELVSLIAQGYERGAKS